MKRASFPLLFLCALVFLLPTACRRPHVRNQLESGIWASEKDLWDEAIFRWKKFLAAQPGSVAAHNNLAVAYEKKGMWDEARQEYEAALKIDPLNPSVKYNYDQFQANVTLHKKDGAPGGAERTGTGGDEKR